MDAYYLRTRSVNDGLTVEFRKRLRQPVAHVPGSQINADVRRRWQKYLSMKTEENNLIYTLIILTTCIRS